MAKETICAKTQRQHSIGVAGSWVSLVQEVHEWGTKLEKEVGGTDYKRSLNTYNAKEIGHYQVAIQRIT